MNNQRKLNGVKLLPQEDIQEEYPWEPVKLDLQIQRQMAWLIVVFVYQICLSSSHIDLSNQLFYLCPLKESTREGNMKRERKHNKQQWYTILNKLRMKCLPFLREVGSVLKRGDISSSRILPLIMNDNIYTTLEFQNNHEEVLQGLANHVHIYKYEQS